MHKNTLIVLVLILGVLELAYIAYSVGQSSLPDVVSQAAAADNIAVTPLVNPVSLDIVMNDNYYGFSDSNVISPPSWTVPTGSDMILHFENRGKLKHNWAIVKSGVSIPLPYDESQNSDVLLDAAQYIENSALPARWQCSYH
jgi:hypothetical protein